jgi:N-acetyl-gamma-glutamyl-phosphate reductase
VVREPTPCAQNQGGTPTNVAIIGATGYGGIELVRLLSAHPRLRLAFLSSETYAGRRVCDIYPHLAGLETELRALHPSQVSRECEIALLALPAGKSMAIVPELLDRGTRVVDVGPDFRLRDPALYPRWYKFDHACPGLLQESVFGIPEWHREEMASARLVAAPGCYTTAALLSLAPLVADNVIDVTDIIVDGKTGLSGAGRTSLQLPYHYPEANEDASAYAPGGHRHLPEILQQLGLLAGQSQAGSAPAPPIRLTFTPHLVPMTRGILLTSYVKPARGADVDDLHSSLQRRYAGEPFVQVLPKGEWPHAKWAAGTNLCFIGLAPDRTSGRAVLVSAIDNLGKGMAGQMVQCLNLMLGLDERTGLAMRAVYP